MERTRHYGLPLFEGSDKPSILVDWNQTMNDIDNAMFQIATGGDSSVVDAITALQQGLDSVNTQIATINTELDDKLDTTFLNNIAPKFDSTSTYQMYDMVFNDGNLYMCAFPYSSGNVFDQCFTPIWLGKKVTDLIIENQTQAGQISALDGRVTDLENAQPEPVVFSVPSSMTEEEFVNKYCDLVKSGYYSGSIQTSVAKAASTTSDFAGLDVTITGLQIELGDFLSSSDIASLQNGDLLAFYIEPIINGSIYIDGADGFAIPKQQKFPLLYPTMFTFYNSNIRLEEQGYVKMSDNTITRNGGKINSKYKIKGYTKADIVMEFQGNGNEVYQCRSLMPFMAGFSNQGIKIGTPNYTETNSDIRFVLSNNGNISTASQTPPYINTNWSSNILLGLEVWKVKNNYKNHFTGLTNM